MSKRTRVLGTDFYDPHYLADRCTQAIGARLSGRPLSDPARAFRDATAGQLARLCLMIHSRTRDIGKSDAACLTEALALATDDLKIRLANIATTIMLAGLLSVEPAYPRIARRNDLRDFRLTGLKRASDFPPLLEVNEHGEVKYGHIPDSGETIALHSYGRIVPVTRATLMADQMDDFAEMFRTAGQRVADVENRVFFETCVAPNAGFGPVLADGDTLFHANHANIAGAGSIGTSIEDARATQRKQTAPDGRALNTRTASILVSPDHESTAEAIVESFGSREQIAVLADAHLTGTRYYTFASPAVLPMFSWGRLAMDPQPHVTLRDAWGFDGVEFRVVTDFACAPVDHRGGVTAAGA